MDPKQIAKLVWDERKQGRYFPEASKGLQSVEDGEQIMLEVLDLDLASGEALAGWKVAFTSKATQEQIGYYSRGFGYLLKSRELNSGVVLNFDELIEPFFENELCVTLGAELQGPNVSPSQARAAIASIAPAIELVERRGDVTGYLPAAVADNGMQRNFITGTITSPLDPGIDLQESSVEVYVNGTRMEKADGHAVMEGPQGSVAWLANKLSEYGRNLFPGDKIMTGSFTQMYKLDPHSQIEARFTPFGTVTFEVR